MSPATRDGALFQHTVHEASDTIEVLHVDDDAGFADVTATILAEERDRLTVATETAPTTALDRVRRSPQAFDCLLVDYQMPNMTGVELLKGVREGGYDGPVILFTRADSDAVLDEALAAGVTDIITKRNGTEQYRLVANRIVAATRQHRRRKAAVRDANYYRNLIESAPAPVTMYTQDGEYVYANQAAVSFFGADSRDAIVGRSKLDLVVPSDRSAVTDRLQQLSAGRPVPTAEHLYDCLDGTRQAGVAACSPITIGDHAAGVTVIHADGQQYDRSGTPPSRTARALSDSESS